jgi:hypothetical protein
MLDRDIWIAASAIIKLHGDDATAHAAMHADALQHEGDGKGCAVWKRIVAAINELRNPEPGGKPH